MSRNFYRSCLLAGCACATLLMPLVAEAQQSCQTTLSCPNGGTVSCSATGQSVSCTGSGSSVTCEATNPCGPNCTEITTRTVSCGGGGFSDPENPAP